MDNKDLEIMIKMESLIGMNEKRLFGRKKNRKTICNDWTISYDDFINYINLIQKIIDKHNK